MTGPSKETMKYADYPYAPKGGYRSGSNYLTAALFVETQKAGQEHIQPRYTLKEDDVEEGGVVYPSARLIYLASKGEHDAMSKLVGSYYQWLALKELAWFREKWEMWHAEWLMLQGQDAREQLRTHALVNVSAASTLFKDAKTHPTVGRPKKERQKRDDSAAYEEDAARVVAIRG